MTRINGHVTKKKSPFKLMPFDMSEEELQIMCYNWLESSKYRVLTKLYFFNSFQGMYLTGRQRAQAKRTGGFNSGMPDFMFLKNNGSYSGLFIELKKDCPYNKDGTLQKHFDKKTGKDHYAEQNDVLELLKIEGHYACFVWSLEQFKTLVTKYMENQL